MMFYAAASTTQRHVRVWHDNSEEGIILSADDIMGKSVSQVYNLLDINNFDIIVDSGGFRLISKGLKLNPAKILETQKKLDNNVKVVPFDLPIHWKDTNKVREKKINLSLKNAKLWSKQFTSDRLLYAVHGHNKDELVYYIERLLNTIEEIKYVGLGSVALFSRYNPKRLFELMLDFSEICKNFQKHIFGIGNSSAVTASKFEFNSVDSSSYLQDSRFGLVRHPKTYQMLVITNRKTTKKKITPSKLFQLDCDCQVCKNGDKRIQSWESIGFNLRAIHNFHMFKRMVKKGYQAKKYENAMKRVLQERKLSN